MLDRMRQFDEQENANIGRGIYNLSNKATYAFEKVREQVAGYIQAESANCIAFTSGTTDSINVIATSFLSNKLSKGHNIVATIMEHHANFLPWQRLAKERGVELRLIPVDDTGRLEISAARDLIDTNTKLLAVTHVSNSLGVLNPVKELSGLAHEGGVPILIDAAQSALGRPDVSDLDCDFLVFSGHKIFGPFGIGVLYAKERFHNAISPYSVGGGIVQKVLVETTTYRDYPHHLDAGTPNVSGVIGLGEAIDYVQSIPDAMLKFPAQLAQYARDELRDVPGLSLVGDAASENIVSFTLEEIHPHDIASFLSQKNIAVRAGTHCNQPLMKFLGLPGTTRASFSIYNTEKEVDILKQAILDIQKIWL